MGCNGCTWSEQCAEEYVCEYYDPIAGDTDDSWRKEDFYESWWYYVDSDGLFFSSDYATILN